MPETTSAARDLIHLLNGQVLKALEEHLAHPNLLGAAWQPTDWIINVILLSRSSEAVYAARLGTSATLYEGTLFDRQEVLDPARVGAFDLPVPIDKSFSGYCVQTGDPVWVEDLDNMPADLQDYYRKFDYVAVHAQKRPRAEFVFPIVSRIGLIQSLLGVLNMEYFGTGTPFESTKQVQISRAIRRLLNAHAPFLLMAQLQEVAELTSTDSSFADTVRDLHNRVMTQRTSTFSRGNQR